MGWLSKLKIALGVAKQVAPMIPGKAGRVINKGLEVEGDVEDLAREFKKPKPAEPTKPAA